MLTFYLISLGVSFISPAGEAKLEESINLIGFLTGIWPRSKVYSDFYCLSDESIFDSNV